MPHPAVPIRLAAGLLLSAITPAAWAGELVVRVENTYGTEGDVRVAVYDSAQAFDNNRAPVAASVLRLSAPHAMVAFAPLPPGRYAVRVFQDLNRNGEIDRNLLGIPREPFGFSNNAMGDMGPPGLDAAAVEVGDGVTDAPVTLIR